MITISFHSKTARSVITILLFLAATAAYSQPGGDGPVGGGPQTFTANDIADIQTAWMKKKLKLNKEQVEKVRDINKIYVSKKQELQKAGEKQSDKLDEPDKERDNNLKIILTEKQFASYLKKKSELENSMSSSGNTGMPPPPPPAGGF
jgi:hypothetical protein